ncbi:MAG TPA: PHP domain-containing protein [Propioniciclava tarda]|nr:PHP domain-containing protein [Propioniciclava tarda]HQA31268.1 PHP domain-containing protein [Propioniciclava tarda]HQD60972.1 PHP domain-containing protein [Propioniciclava tarda]
MTQIDPVEALREIAYLLERAGGQTRKATAFRKAADVLTALTPADRAVVDAARSWTSLPGIGESTAKVIAQASDGILPEYLASVRDETASFDSQAGPLLGAIRGELHSHTDASDGYSPLPDMVDAARALGREYLAVTDHSPNLRVARGLDASRLRAQLDDIAALNREVAPFRILTGIEADILNDGALDQEPGLLDALDVVVASVHSKLRMDADAMTSRMVAAIANPRSDILGHVTGRLIAGGRGTRPQSAFDAEVVFEACRHFGKAVEINSRPERLDPPDDLLALASEMGCLFAIDTDAHAPGQLEWTVHGVRKAMATGIDADRIVNTWPVERLLDWTASHQN